MGKRKYNSPILMAITPGNDPTIPVGPSQGTSGEVNMYRFDPKIADEMDMYDYFDYEEMDTNHDLYITEQEYINWLG